MNIKNHKEENKKTYQNKRSVIFKYRFNFRLNVNGAMNGNNPTEIIYCEDKRINRETTIN